MLPWQAHANSVQRLFNLAYAEQKIGANPPNFASCRK